MRALGALMAFAACSAMGLLRVASERRRIETLAALTEALGVMRKGFHGTVARAVVGPFECAYRSDAVRSACVAEFSGAACYRCRGERPYRMCRERSNVRIVVGAS